MYEIVRLIFFSLILFPVIVYRDLQFSTELMSEADHYKNIPMKARDKHWLLIFIPNIRNVRLLGLIYHLTTTLPSLIISVVLALSSVVKIVKIMLDLKFIWLSTDFLVLFSFVSMGYSVVMMLLFGFLSWILKKKRGL